MYRFVPQISDDGKYILMSIRKDSGPTCMLYIGDLETTGNVISLGYEWNKLVDNFDSRYI